MYKFIYLLLYYHYRRISQYTQYNMSGSPFLTLTSSHFTLDKIRGLVGKVLTLSNPLLSRSYLVQLSRCYLAQPSGRSYENPHYYFYTYLFKVLCPYCTIRDTNSTIGEFISLKMIKKLDLIFIIKLNILLILNNHKNLFLWSALKSSYSGKHPS